MRNKLLAILLVVMMVFMFSACTSSTPPPAGDNGDDGNGVEAEQVSINLWHIYVDETDENRVTTEKVIAEYMDAHPNVKIEQHILQDADYKTKMLTEFSGSASNIDIFSYWGAGRAGDIVNAGKMLCIEDYLSPDKVAAIKHGADNNFRYGGKLYGLPMASWMMVLYCNVELFEDNNIALPETYDEWLDACKKFDAAGIIPVALGGGVDDGWQAAFVYEALVNRIVGALNEAKVLDDMAGFAGNDGFVEAAEKMVEMNAANAFGKSPLEIDEVTSNVQFFSGVAAMRLTGSWFTTNVYTDEDSVVAGKVTALPIPIVPGGNGKDTDYVGGFIDGWFVNAATQHPEVVADLAWELSVAMGTHQHEIGEGFTAFNYPTDESGLTPLGKEVSALANRMVDGMVAWDTFLPGDLADIHIDACQALLAARANVGAFIEEYTKIFD
ncbi:MAG: extracellular solute-binding protein [Clostridiales bacterium]|nr:extracellular solute-binding protein [Clostridiales bacterium]